MDDLNEISARVLTLEDTDSFRENFEGKPLNKLAQKFCMKDNPFSAIVQKNSDDFNAHVFNHKVEREGRPVTNQNNSGRCWLFSAMNCARIPFSVENKLDGFEFSQNYLHFWDKVERVNYLLNIYVELAKNEEDPESRLSCFLRQNPSEDGGQYDMLVNLIKKYGVLPKDCFPDTYSSGYTRKPLQYMLNNKTRQFCLELQNMVKKGMSDDDISTEIKEMNKKIYRIVATCLGTPPKTFTWDYYDKDNNFHSIGPISPQDFYNEYVKKLYNFEDMVVLTNDPRPSNPYNKLYTVQYLGNVVGGKKTLYINQPIDKLKEAAAATIRDNNAVWFGCDVQHFSNWHKGGILDLNSYDTETLFGSSVSLPLSKADRISYGVSFMDHAMVLSGYHDDQDGNIKRWRVENSWGDKGGQKGYFSMTDDWFTEFVYIVAVDKKYLSPEQLAILDTEPIVLPAWDPMGTLAK